MATGKTTIGAALATRLDWPFHDNDTEIAATTGSTAAERAAGAGLATLHAEELAALRAGLNAPAPAVVAAAASVLDRAELADLLGAQLVVGLTAGEETMRRRHGGSAHRPELAGDPIGAPELRAARLAALDAVCDVVLDTTGRAVDDIVTDLARWVARLSPPSGPAPRTQ